ncbi:MAG: SagB/ThcOx family dehydrogenase [Firmicutes bacterium]|nr:SagB/ThcOx family dehydrogenase [Bacillota bacterium]
MNNSDVVKLPEFRYSGGISVEEALLRRRSYRRYKDEPLTLAEVGQLLWAAQGITRPEKGFRTAPSAGALFPLEIYLVAGNVNHLPKGVYKYKPRGHEIIKTIDGDLRDKLVGAALGQSFIANAPISIVIAAVYERTTSRYGKRGIRYVYMDAGLAAENVYLQAVPNLGTVFVGAFDDDAVKSLLKLPDGEYPLCILPVGRV